MVLIYKFIFFFSLAAIFYTYLGYPILIFLMGSILNKKVKKDPFYEPSVSILIAAYNEADVIEETIKNKLELEYPSGKYEIIVISDESTDGTDEIVARYSYRNVRLIRQEPRAGKTSALNLALSEAKGEIIIFSDANSIYDKYSLKLLVQNFADHQIGYVTGKMVYMNPDGSITGDGCSVYMKYENLLRKYETKVGSVVGVDGGIDAVRKELYQPMNPDQLPDFVLPLNVVIQGFRVVYEPNAILKEDVVKGTEDEYKMRVRVSLRALWAISDLRKLLSISNFTIFSFQLWSHKVIRYGCFLFLLTAYMSNMMLWDSGLKYQLFFIFQNIAYASAALTPLINKIGYKIPLTGLCHYFVLLNLASAHAFIKFILRRKQSVWTPRKG